MPTIAGAFSVQRRSKKNKSFIFTINVESGLPPEMCTKWQRKSFACLPPELAAFRFPTSKVAAENGVKALIELIKKEIPKGAAWRYFDSVPVGSWLIRFTCTSQDKT